MLLAKYHIFDKSNLEGGACPITQNSDKTNTLKTAEILDSQNQNLMENRVIGHSLSES